MRDHVLATLTRSVPAAVAESALAYAAAQRMDMAARRRAAQLESGVAGGVLTPREASSLRRRPSVCGANFRSTSRRSRAWQAVDLRLRLDKAPQWEGEIGLDAWLADEHPATCTPRARRALPQPRFCHLGHHCGGQEQRGAGGVAVLREREADKLYAALVFGHPEWDERKIKAPINGVAAYFKQRRRPGKSAETHAFVGARGTLKSSRILAAAIAALARAEDGRRHQHAST